MIFVFCFFPLMLYISIFWAMFLRQLAPCQENGRCVVVYTCSQEVHLWEENEGLRSRAWCSAPLALLSVLRLFTPQDLCLWPDPFPSQFAGHIPWNWSSWDPRSPWMLGAARWGHGKDSDLNPGALCPELCPGLSGCSRHSSGLSPHGHCPQTDFIWMCMCVCVCVCMCTCVRVLCVVL